MYCGGACRVLIGRGILWVYARACLIERTTCRWPYHDPRDVHPYTTLHPPTARADETGGVVFDAGSYTCKVGYAGDDMPKSVFNGRAGVLKGVTEPGAARASTESAPKTRYLVGPSSTQYRPHMELRPPTDYGLVEDWDMMEAVWAHGFDSVRADPREHPLVLSEPPFSIMAQREKVVRGTAGGGRGLVWSRAARQGVTGGRARLHASSCTIASSRKS